MPAVGVDWAVTLVDASGAAVSGLTSDTELPAAVALTADNQAAPTTPIVGSVIFGVDQGSSPFTYSSPRMHTAASDGRANSITGVVVQSRLYVHNNNTPGSGTSDIVRSASAAAGGTGTGLLGVGPLGIAVAHGSNPAEVTAAQYARWLTNRAGIPFVIGGTPNIQTLRATYNSAQTDTAVVTVSTGTIIVVTSFLFTVDNATTVNVSARLGFGTANTPTTTQTLGSHPGIAPGSGFGRGSGAGILGIGADNEDLRVTISVPTSGNVDLNVSYYTISS